MSEDVIVCPACETENDVLSKTCLHCGQSLIVVCPRCYTVNTITAAQCSACGQQFDMLGHILAREEIRTSDRFTRHAATVGDVKQDEKVQANARGEQLWKVEQERQAYLYAQKRRQKQQERFLVIGTAVVVVVVVVVSLIVGLAH
jgi:transcription elongation factor Elf1